MVPAHRRTGGSAISPDTPTRSVLIADDEADIRAIVAQLLGPELPARVEEAADGREAIRLLRRETPDLLLLDLLMPRLDGAAVLEWMRRRGRTAVPVVALTAARGEAADAALADGCAAVLPKPFDLDELLDVVRAQLDLAA